MTVTVATLDHVAGIHALEAHFPARERWSPAAWRDEVTATDRWVGVVTVDEVVVAAATVQSIGDLSDLHRVVVAPGQRGRGLARDLIRTGLAWAAVRGATSMLLEVSAGNLPARSLYRSLGFDEISLRRDYYGSGEDAVVMSMNLERTQGASA